MGGVETSALKNGGSVDGDPKYGGVQMCGGGPITIEHPPSRYF